MKPERLPPIPTPLKQHWREARVRVMPVLVFGAAVCAVAVLWNKNVAVPTMVGQVEPILVNISSHKAGVLAHLAVQRFQKVKAGDVIGQVMIADPQVAAASLDVVRGEIEMLRANLQPIAAQQRNAVNYAQLRLDWMRQRVALVSAQANVQMADAELRRTEELFKDKIVSQSVLDVARAAQQSLAREVEELAKLVAEGESSFRTMHPTNAADMATISDEPLRAALAVQEAKLRLAEAEASPIPLRAPIDGIITAINHRPGESVIAGQPIVALSTLQSARIVGYLRPPILDEPKPGMRVEVRTRGLRRESASAQVIEVGTQLENLPPTMLGPIRLATVELGLPVEITLPDSLKIRPGELVDIRLIVETN